MNFGPLRFAFFVLAFSPVMIVYDLIVIRLVIWPLAKLKPGSSRVGAFSFNLWSKLLLGIVRWIWRIKITVYGDPPPHGAYVVVANHQSLLDIPVQVASMGDRANLHYVLKKELKWGVPVISPGARAARMAFVDRKKGLAWNERQLRQLADRLVPQRISLVIYPEGTRSRDGRLRVFKPGGLKLIAAATEAPLLPVVGDGLWQTSTLGDIVWRLYGKHIRIRIGEPIPMAEYRADPEGTTARIRRWMLDSLVSMRTLDGDPATDTGQPGEVAVPCDLGPGGDLRDIGVKA
jgi:1-acyl-sn-glycerol-3-phosphate acyltransferase